VALGLVTSGGAAVVTQPTEAALRAAMAGGGAVTFACSGTITLTNAITITNDTVLDATGHAVTITGNNQVFVVSADVTFTAVNFGIAYSAVTQASGGGPPVSGAGIESAGTLNLCGVSFSNNVITGMVGGMSSPMGAGGAIFVDGGMVNATNCIFLGNYAARGGSMAIGDNSQVNLHACLFQSNGAASAAEVGGGNPAQGGAIWNQGSLLATECIFAGNSAVAGAGITPPPYENQYYPGAQGGDGMGGAIFNQGTLAIWNSTLVGNSGSGGAGGNGEQGYVETVNNGGFPYQQVIQSESGGSGGDGYGALYNMGTASAVNCTFCGNTGAGGAGGPGGPAWSGYVGLPPQTPVLYNFPAGGPGNRGAGYGAIYSATAGLYLTNCTIALNGGSGEAGSLAGFYLSGGIVVNTLVATNYPTNALLPLSGSGVLDAGGNLSSDGSCGFDSGLNSVDPLLGPLADNGGPTPTMALLPGSPAIGRANPASAPPTDQRGVPRPQASSDIGAYQTSAPSAPALTIQLISSTQAIILWPLAADGWQLLEASNSVAGPWTTNSTPLLDTPTQHTVTVSLSGSGCWFRLVQ
jgi:hypothetical protein